MAKLFLIDDDPAVTDILSIIIENQNLGKLCGTSHEAADALEDLPYLQPDIVLVDLLMPNMDGITFVQKARKILPSAAFIMLSQVSAKDMVAKAYDAGVEFFIQKPVNAVEVRQVIENVSQKQNLIQTMDQMRSIFAGSGINAGTSGETDEASRGDNSPEKERLRRILQDLGLTGEVGCDDILTIVTYFCLHQEDLSGMTMKELCSRFSSSPKSMEQRIRRTAAIGLSNLAHLGLDDYGNEIFDEYASRLYSFQEVRREMDFIQEKTDQHGKVRIRKFISALVSACTE